MDLNESISSGLKKRFKGGKGSGFHGHAGRPGKVGGSRDDDVNFTADNFFDFFGATQDVFDERGYTQKKQDYNIKLKKIVKNYLDRNPETTTASFDEDTRGIINDLTGKYGDNAYSRWEMDALFSIRRVLGNELTSRVLKAVSRGDITPDEGKKIVDIGNESWKSLPQELFHATVDADSVIKDGIKSRYDRGGSEAAGLGGGNDKTISFTGNSSYAKEIERGLHEMWLVANKKLTVEKMIDLSRSGAGGVGHDWSSSFLGMLSSIVGMSDEQKLIDMDSGKLKRRINVFSKTEEDYSESDLNDFRESVFKAYQSARASAGGFENPMFAFNDINALKRMDPSNFKVLKYKPSSKKSMGQYLWAEDEYRVGGGDAIKFVDSIDFFDPTDLDSIYGIVTTTKGGKGSGNFGHSGRPGKVGGSQPNNNAVNIPKSFRDDPKRMKMALDHYIPKDDHLVYSVVSSMASRLTRYKPSEYGEIGDELEEYILGKRPEWGSSDDDWNKYWKKREESQDKLYLSEDEYRFIYNTLKPISDARIDKLRESLGLPQNVEDLFGKEISDPASGAWGKTRDQEKVDALYKKVNDLSNRVIEGADFYEYSPGEIYSGLVDRYEEQLDGLFGPQEYYDANGKIVKSSAERSAAQSWMYELSNYLRDGVNFVGTHMVATGEITPDEAENKGFSIIGEKEKWTDLPEDLWHVTTNTDSVLDIGLKSRYELGGRSAEVGLGGGEDKTISFTNDERTAKSIERALQEAHMVASGRIDAHMLLDSAAVGGGGVESGENWLYKLTEEQNKSDLDINTDRDKFPRQITTLLDLEDGKTVTLWGGETVNIKNNYDRYLELLWDFYHIQFLNARDFSGGFMNPVFFGTNWRNLAKLDPNGIKTLHFKAKKGSRGYRVSGLGEWRTVGGDTVDLEDVVDHFYDGDPLYLLGM